jgi:hypothetical protein
MIAQKQYKEALNILKKSIQLQKNIESLVLLVCIYIISIYIMIEQGI